MATCSAMYWPCATSPSTRLAAAGAADRATAVRGAAVAALTSARRIAASVCVTLIDSSLSYDRNAHAAFAISAIPGEAELDLSRTLHDAAQSTRHARGTRH